MSLRLNLYGWNSDKFRQVLGSGNQEVLERSQSLVAEAFKKEELRDRGQGWLRTLINEKIQLRSERLPAQAPTDGGLLNVLMETEVHAIAVDCLRRAVTRADHLDLSMDSSSWSHPAVLNLHRELRTIDFNSSQHGDRRYWTWISVLSNGSPLFGDDFRSDWSYYSILSADDVAGFIPFLKAAVDFERKLPSWAPAGEHPTSLSEMAKKFAMALCGWFEQIQQAGQEPFIIWW